MESWVKQRLDVLLPVLAACSASDEERIAQACSETVEALHNRGLGSMLSYKRPMREMRNALRDLAEQSVSPNPYELALQHLVLAEDERVEMARSSNAKREKVFANQSMIYKPREVLARLSKLLTSSDEWEEIAAGLSLATGRRLAEVLRFAQFREKSLYSVTFSGQRKSDNDDEYEIPTLVPGAVVVTAWQRLRELRDFESVDSDKISSSFGEPVRDVVVRQFSDLIESPAGRAHLYTHALRAVYPCLAIHLFLPPHVNELLFANEILGHVINRDGVVIANLESTLYYMGYKIANEDANGNLVIDGREGIMLGEPGVEILERFQPKEKKQMPETAEGGRTKIGLDRSVKLNFDEAQKELGAATANEAMQRLLAEHNIYKQIASLVGGADELVALYAILVETAEIKLADESVIDALRAAVSDKRRFRANYAQRSVNMAERDYTSMSMDELNKQRTPEASQEKWRRAVNDLIAWNDKATMSELRFYINAAVVKQAVGGRGTEIKKYLETRQEEIDTLNQLYKLKPSINYGRNNVRERLYPDLVVEPDEEE